MGWHENTVKIILVNTKSSLDGSALDGRRQNSARKKMKINFGTFRLQQAQSRTHHVDPICVEFKSIVKWINLLIVFSTLVSPTVFEWKLKELEKQRLDARWPKFAISYSWILLIHSEVLSLKKINLFKLHNHCRPKIRTNLNILQNKWHFVCQENKRNTRIQHLN